MIPSAINLHKASKTLTLKYASGEEYHLPAELLRVHSPSAEVQGHGKPILQFGKINVGLLKIEPAGQYFQVISDASVLHTSSAHGEDPVGCSDC